MNCALLLSGGTGSRIESKVPKQYLRVGTQMIITRSLLKLLAHPMIECVWIVACDEWQEVILDEVPVELVGKLRGFAEPGETRSGSIVNGLEVMQGVIGAEDVVLIHDAARPNVSGDTITACLEACKEHDGAMPVLPMKDTVYESVDGKLVTRLLDREHIYAGQAPEAFVYGKYVASYEKLNKEQIAALHGSSEPAIMAGMDIAMIPGDENNNKITTDVDLKRLMGGNRPTCESE